jgi:hypothetical protein
VRRSSIHGEEVGGGGSSPELLADGKDGKTRTAAVFSDEVGSPMTGGVLHRGGKEEEAQAQVYPKKKAAPRGELLHRRGEGGEGRQPASE